MEQDTPICFQRWVEDVEQVHIRRVPLLSSYYLVGADGKPRAPQLGVQALLLGGAEYRRRSRYEPQKSSRSR